MMVDDPHRRVPRLIPIAFAAVAVMLIVLAIVGWVSLH